MLARVLRRAASTWTLVADAVRKETTEDVNVRGWVRSVRAQKSVGFVTVDDGSSAHVLQVVCAPRDAEKLTVGASVEVRGKLVPTPKAKQPVELQAETVHVVGACDASQYPLQPKYHTREFLREIPHLRPRQRSFAAILRVRSALAQAIHSFFDRERFHLIHTPILTGQDCEGAGELFAVLDAATLDAPSSADASSGERRYLLGKRANLTVSGQLHLETAACALGRVYTFGPAFRADPSTTPRHLCEFWMVEPEMAWADMEAASHLAERCVQEVSRAVRDRCAADLALIEATRRAEPQAPSSPSTPQIPLDGRPFVRMSYDEAIDVLQRSGQTFHTPPEWGRRLATEHEQWLCGSFCGGRPVFVMHFPTSAAPFYARPDDTAASSRGPTAATFDLLTAAGELVGGGVREERHDVLRDRMAAAGMSLADYGWYLDLRRYGSVPHAGWGLGFERLLMALTGVDNIRETMLVPRAPGMCLM